jgi:hypothetical protein
MTWTDINIKTLMGPLWMKYKKFKLIFTSHGGAPQAGISDTNRIVNVYMEGLRWVHSSYDTSVNANRTRALVGTLEYTTTGRTTNYVNESGFIFDTQQTNANLRIYLTRMTDDTIVNTQYPPSAFCFSIYGVDE